MSDITRAHRALVERILDGEGNASREQRRAAFDNTVAGEPLGILIGKVAESPQRVTDGDVEAVRASGLSEEQIYELMVCAAVGQAARQYDSALAALALASGEDKGASGHS